MDKAIKVHCTIFPSRFVSEDPFASGDKVIAVKSKEDKQKMTTYGHIGDPTKASRVKGETLFNGIVKNLIELIENLRKI
jgi:creatinine amidohydrolase/Fe(II)-dependent formamide hydrolase-like protein